MEEEVKESTESQCKGTLVKDVDIIVNSVRYVGNAIINEDGSVNLHDIADDDVLDNTYVTYYSVRIATLRKILEGHVLHLAGYDTIVAQCHTSHYYLRMTDMVYTEDSGYMCQPLTTYFRGQYYNSNNCSHHYYRDAEGSDDFFAPDSYWEDLYYCDHCDCYVPEEFYDGGGYCHECASERQPKVIEDYCESHTHNSNPVLFGDYKDTFVGLGFELEVDCDEEPDDNVGVARNLCSACGLEENEMRYAYDGSLNYGFECISEPHTIKDFWDKAPKWQKMLKYLLDNGYKSHDPGTCGLHVHVSREMFGKTKEVQDAAIAKVYTFFDTNWDDICRVSRRRSFDYCGKNCLQYEDKYDSKKKTLYDKWKNSSKHSSGHHVALNNANAHTFEYRLGRGTLNAWSFFAWIDFVLTITKNAKRITIGKVNSNDLLSWLGGIKETTARYIYKRGAFRKEMLALYPSIEWETDMADSSY